MHITQTTSQAIGSWTIAGTVIILAGWGILKTGWWLWRWSGRVAERMAERECLLAERLAAGRAVR